jgi:cytochrome P450
VINLRYAAGNRDERMFECPAEVDLERDKPRRHLAFGVGTHHCLGAPLARRELFYGFKAMIDSFDEMWFIDGANDFAHHQNFFLRAMKELHVGFKPKADRKRSEARRTEDYSWDQG